MNIHPEGMAGIVCKFDGDRRLIAGAVAIAGHVARRAGLTETAASAFSAAAGEACNAITASLEDMGALRFELEFAVIEFQDHVEVAIDLLPAAPNTDNPRVSSEQSAGLTEKIRQKLNRASFDGVEVGINNGYPHVTLVKNGASVRRSAF